jgi:hypothetical protein
MIEELSQPFLHWKSAISSIMSLVCRRALGYYRMQSQKLLMFHWGSSFRHCRDVVAALLPTMGAEIVVLSKWHCTAFSLGNMQGQKLLPLRWRWYFGCATHVSFAFVAITLTNPFILTWAENTAFWFLNVADLWLLTLLWSTFLGWGSEHVICLLGCDVNKYIYFSRSWQCSPLIVECVRQRSVDTVVGNSTHHYQAMYWSLYVTGLGLSRFCILPSTRLYNLRWTPSEMTTIQRNLTNHVAVIIPSLFFFSLVFLSF